VFFETEYIGNIVYTESTTNAGILINPWFFHFDSPLAEVTRTA
jgi:hypothetical protein